MDKHKNTLYFWCIQNKHKGILEEFDFDHNENIPFGLSSPNTIKWNSPLAVWWKCYNGHLYKMPVIRKTKYNSKCPVCFPDGKFLPSGTKNGCLTIIDRTTETNCFGKEEIIYKTKCSCSNVVDLSEFKFLSKQHKHCGDSCKNKKPKIKTIVQPIQKQTEPLVDYAGKTFGSLKILRCIDDNGTYREWECCCDLCGKTQLFSDYCFDIELVPYIGWWADAQCDCYKISSFQWAVTKLLFENDISYSVEYSFPDLLGQNGHPLRFDFALFNNDNTIRVLIECQGEQHYKPIESFGGDQQFELQQKYDNMKRKYTKQHNIPLLEISFKDKNIDVIKAIFQKNGIL